MQSSSYVSTQTSRLTLAVAGSRKTQWIVEECAAKPVTERILILTYTTANQLELRSRLAKEAGDHPRVEVLGWFSFLLNHFVRPFVPYSYLDARLAGFDFKSPPQQGVPVASKSRYFNDIGQVRKVHLPQLVARIEADSSQAGIRRIERIYDRIYIDEVQDLCGYDLEVLKLLIKSSIPLAMVGDVRQAILATNEREPKNKRYMYMGIWAWFRGEERAGRITIQQNRETWRCRQEIATFADSVFDSKLGFAETISRNVKTTTHDGIFLVRLSDVEQYVRIYSSLALRDSTRSGRSLDHLNFTNFGLAKGLSRERVLIYPTGAISKFLQSGTPLTDMQASRFYVAVTRAEQSVGIILDEPGGSTIQYWEPPNPA
jgi:DNA helicase-2/ATP-dependent DNA helicase PcrA